MIKIEERDGRIYIYTPYNSHFVTKVKNIGGAKWTGEAWSAPGDSIDVVREILMECYGETDTYQAPKVNVKITFNKDIEEYRGPICMLGKTIARARGRDSGARLGEDVVLVKGRAKSSGSRANWYTTIEAETEIMVYNVSKDLYDNFDPKMANVTCELVEKKNTSQEQILKERTEKVFVEIAELIKDGADKNELLRSIQERIETV